MSQPLPHRPALWPGVAACSLLPLIAAAAGLAGWLAPGPALALAAGAAADDLDTRTEALAQQLMGQAGGVDLGAFSLARFGR